MLSGLLSLGIGANAVAQTEPPERVPVSMNAGETYTIGNLKDGSVPSVRVVQNPNAMVINNGSPGRVVLVGAEAGHWLIGVTNSSDRAMSYDVTVSAIAIPGRPLAAGKAPAPLSDMGLTAREGAGSSTPETLPLPSPPSPASAPALHVASSRAPSAATTEPSASTAPTVTTGDVPYLPNQAAGPLESRTGQFRNDPAVADNGAAYSSESTFGERHYLPDDGVSLMTGTSQVIDFKRRVVRISVADSKIADVQVINPFQLNLIGHQPGFTTIAIWDSQGQYQEREVRIDPSGKQQVMLNTIVAELDRTGIENQGINVSVALAKSGLSLVSMPGSVATPFSAQSSGSGAPSSLPAGGSLIPMLLSQSLTYGLAAQGDGILTQSLFQFLEQHNLGRILAQPHLLANSGEKAKFLSGGEIPIVIAQALNSSIVFKQFGTSVEFIPTVIGRSEIELLVKPEVSQPDYAHGVNLFGFTVPAFVARRAETLVRLKDRQTLIIAGLILHDKSSTVQKVPYLGDLPFAGALFRNTYWQDKETDLVMSVTPEIVNPLPHGGQVYLPSNRGPLSADEIRTKEINPPDASRPRF
jgi:Flp pilus assembly secretin CpaC